MSQKEIRPATNEADCQNTTATTTTLSDQSRLCAQHGGATSSPDAAVNASACRVCQAEYKHRWYWKNRDRILAHQRQYRAANLGIVWLNHYRERERRYGLTLPANLITPQDLISRYGDACYYNPNHPFEVIDHVIPIRAGGPHQLWNVVPCCRGCDAAKRWGSDRVLIKRFDEDRARDAGTGPSDATSAT
jgi:5-methylcytosine-specific restriction endonuclease McrA